MRGWGMQAFMGRAADRPLRRPQGLLFWLDGRPSAPLTFGLAVQHLAVQSTSFLLAAAAAAAVTQDPAESTRFICLSILALALWQGLQVLTRGPLGSGYPIPAAQAVAMIGAYVVAGAAGMGFGAIGAMVLLTGLAAILLTFVMQRLRVVLPNEVAGVVVILIGVSLAGLATRLFGLQPGGTPPGWQAVATLGVSLLLMALLALSRTRAAPLAVLIGAAGGVVLALALGQGAPNAAAILAERPWFALPEPWAPRFDDIEAAPMVAFLLSLIALRANVSGALVVAQRAVDAEWTRPDAPPIRRGLLADGVAVAAAGLVGGAAPAPNTAALGLSIVSGTMARRIAWAGIPLLVLTALCPKLVALFVVIPAPVKAAMLFYIAGFIMAQGCQLTATRLLDTRRSMVVAFGLCAGIAVASAPLIFLAELPAIASPLAFGALVAFLVNLATQPLVAVRAERVLALDPGAAREAAEWIAGLAAGWGLRPQTARQAEHALDEICALLAARGVDAVRLAARRSEDRVELTLAWAGARLPERAGPVSAEALLDEADGAERVAMWLATRGAVALAQRRTEAGWELRVAFED